MINRRSFAAGAAFSTPLFAAAAWSGASTEQYAIFGGAIMLDSDEIRLDDILAPRISDISGKPEPFAQTARQTLMELIDGQELDIRDTDDRDRWGRRIAHVFHTDIKGVRQSLQEMLVAKGCARVDPRSDQHEHIHRLQVVENEARNRKLGLWRLRRYSVVDAVSADRAIGAFHLVEGKVLKAVMVSGRTYLNFGADYKTDFTVTARSVLSRRWAKKSVDLLALADQRIRARGFVKKINGPTIELIHPLQIEVV